MKTWSPASFVKSFAGITALSTMLAVSPAAADPLGPDRAIDVARELMTLKLIARECSLGAELDQTVSLLAGPAWARLHTIVAPAVVERTREGVEADVDRRLQVGRASACADAGRDIIGYSSGT